MSSQSVLTIDVSVNPAVLQVVRVEGRILEVLETREMDFNGYFVGPVSPSLLETSSHGDNEGNPENPIDTVSKALEYSAQLKSLLQSISNPWTTSVILIPGSDYISLNLELPFSDPKQIERVVDLEVQDRVPFEVSDFLIEHRALKRLSSNATDIHVSIIPKERIRSLLAICRQAGLEPLIVTTPSSVLEALYYVGPEYFQSDSALLLERDPLYYLAVRVDDQVRVDRVLFRRTEDSLESSQRALLTDLRVTLSSVETRYERKLSRIYFIGNQALTRDFQLVLGREVEWVNLEELIKSSSVSANPLALAAPFALDLNPPEPLTNFRTREFSYSIQLTEVLAGFWRLFPTLLITMVIGIIVMMGVYFVREVQISQIKSAMHDKIRAAIPDIPLAEGREADLIHEENNKLDRALEGLGSLSKLTPLDLLSEMAEVYFSVQSGKGGSPSSITVKSVSIRNNLVRTTLLASKIQDIENFSRALDRHKKIPFRVKGGFKARDSNQRGNAGELLREYDLEIRVLE